MENIVIFAFKMMKIKPFLRFFGRRIFNRLTRLKNKSESELPGGLHLRAARRRLVGFAALSLADFDPSFSRKSVALKYMENQMFYHKLDILGILKCWWLS